jgi:sugar phosphate isomerase/epimerase
VSRQPGHSPREPLLMASGMLAGHSFEPRLKAAAEAGFTGVGLRLAPYQAARRAGHGDADMRGMLRHYGLQLCELQPLMAWALSGAPGQASRAEEQAVYEIAAAVGGDHLIATGLNPDVPFDGVVERFAGLCERAAASGLRVGLECLPWTAIATVEEAWRIVQSAGHRNGGVIIDPWHFYRGAADARHVRAVPGERIVAVHLNDGLDPVGDPIEDTRRRRRLPGEGDFPLPSFVRMLDSVRCSCAWTVEVLSDELEALDTESAAVLAARSSRAVLHAARRTRST